MNGTKVSLGSRTEENRAKLLKLTIELINKFTKYVNHDFGAFDFVQIEDYYVFESVRKSIQIYEPTKAGGQYIISLKDDPKPEIRTTATVNGVKEAVATGSAIIVDEVRYEN